MQRAFAHVGEKIFKVIPSVAYKNSAASVIGIVFIIGVAASVAHSDPDYMRRSPGQSVRPSHRSCSLPTKTTATGCKSGFYSREAGQFYISAIALKSPDVGSSGPDFVSPRQRYKPSEPLTGYVMRFCIRGVSLGEHAYGFLSVVNGDPQSGHTANASAKSARLSFSATDWSRFSTCCRGMLPFSQRAMDRVVTFTVRANCSCVFPVSSRNSRIEEPSECLDIPVSSIA